MDREQTTSRESYQTARRRAFIQDILAELSGRPDDLLAFDDVRQQLNLREPAQATGIQEIPLDKIVGSVGRYRDFNRAFLPRAQISPERWTRIEQLKSLPPIDVFKVDDIYFVRDGNHRVSVARARNHETIHARVVEVPARVPLDADTSPDDLILKSGYAEFLENTGLDRTCADQCIELTRPGGYRSLLQHIEIHQFYMGLRSRHYPTLPEAAEDWYRSVYRPVVERIRAADILNRFPGRTESDLYFWIAENRARLQMRYGDLEAQQAVDEFAHEQHVPGVVTRLRQLVHRLFPRFSPQPAGSPLAEKRKKSSKQKTGDR